MVFNTHKSKFLVIIFIVFLVSDLPILAASDGCSWNGTWTTTWGEMKLTQVGSKVTGTYERDSGRISGTASGDTFTGVWSEAPTYGKPDDAGEVRLKMAPDCNSFEGEWRYGPESFWGWWPWQGRRVMSSAELIVYPSYQLDKGVIELVADPGLAGSTVTFNIEEGYLYCAKLEGTTTESKTATIDDKGKANATLVYTFTSIEDMNTGAPIIITAEGQDGSIIAEYEIDVKDNWDRLLEEYERFPGARANPCVGSYNKIPIWDWTNGPVLDMYELLGIGYEGEENFVCGAFQERIFAWLLKKRFDPDKEEASKMNGISFLPYRMLGGFHRFVGVFPAGMDDKDGGGGALFLDPWWKQSGPADYTRAEEVGMMAQWAARWTIGGGAVVYGAGALGSTSFCISKAVAAEKTLKIAALVTAIESASSYISFGWDSTYDYAVDMTAEQYDVSGIYGLLKMSLDFKDPYCPGYLERFKEMLVMSAQNTPYIVGVFCPVSVTISDSQGDLIHFDQKEKTFTGDFPLIAISVPEDDGTQGLIMSINEDDFDIEAEAVSDGTFSIYRFERGTSRLSSYEEIPITEGDVYHLEVFDGGDPEPLVRADGFEVMPEVEVISAKTASEEGADEAEIEADSEVEAEVGVGVGDARAWYNEGVALDDSGRYEEAIECYDRAIEIDPRYARAFNNRGTDLLSLKRYGDAIESFDAAIGIDPDYKEAWNNKGVTLGHKGEFEDAIDCFEEAIEIDPFYREAWNNMGNAHYYLGNYDDALRCYDTATTIDISDSNAWRNKGHALQKLGRNSEAREAYNRASELEGGG